MEHVSGMARLVEPADVQAHAVTATLPRSEVEEALRSGSSELVLDVTRVRDGDREQPEAVTRTVSVLWDERALENVLESTTGEEVVLAFDRVELNEALEQADVEAHGFREKALVLTVAAATAAGGLSVGQAAAMPLEGTGGAAGVSSAQTSVEQIGGPVAAAGDRSPAETTGGAVPASAIEQTGGPVAAAGDRSPAETTGGAVPASAIEQTGGPVAAAGDRSPAETTGGAVSEPAVGPVAAAADRSPAETTGGAIPAGEAAPAVPVSAPADSDTWLPTPDPAAAALAGGLAAISITAAGFAIRRRRVERQT